MTGGKWMGKRYGMVLFVIRECSTHNTIILLSKRGSGLRCVPDENSGPIHTLSEYATATRTLRICRRSGDDVTCYGRRRGIPISGRIKKPLFDRIRNARKGERGAEKTPTSKATVGLP